MRWQSGRSNPGFTYASLKTKTWTASSPAPRSDTPSRDAITRYGFTGQEEVAAGGIDLIHMNGRMYDNPHIGRFLSADPTIQDPSNSQSLNRYSSLK